MAYILHYLMENGNFDEIKSVDLEALKNMKNNFENKLNQKDKIREEI